jgi:subtilisin family serine protease
MKCRLIALACSLAALCAADTALAQSRKVDEEAVRYATQNTRSRVIIMMQAPESGGQREAYTNPSAYLRSALATHAVGIQNIVPGSSVATAEVTVDGLRRLGNDTRVRRVFIDRLMATSLSDTTREMGAVPSWALGQEGKGALVAILDTGVQNDHPFLRGRVVAEACFSTTSASQNATTACPNNQSEMIGAGAARPCTSPGCNHGTHVAGIVAGLNGHQNPTSPRLDGVARGAGIVAVQVFSNISAGCGANNPTCALSFSSDQLRALLHVKKLVETDRMPIAAVNMSLGGGRHEANCDSDSPLTQVITDLAALNVAVVIAAGNNGFTNAISEPACIRAAVSVGAVDKSNVVASYSNSSELVTLLAPGSNVTSSSTGGTFVQLSGTSMATPHVAGAIAVLRAAAPNRPLADIIGALRSSGVAVTDARNNLARQRIQLDRALAALNVPAAAAAAPSPAAASCPSEGGEAGVVARVMASAPVADAATIEKARAVFGADSAVKVMPDGSLLVTPKGAVHGVAAAGAACTPPAAAPAAPPAPVAPAPPAFTPDAGGRILIR